METIDNIIKEAQKLSDQQLREVLAMAKGMDVSNKLQRDRGA